MNDSKNNENGRWWEFYLVRYLLGSIVGATLLILLNNKSEGIMKGLLSQSDVNISSIEGHTILLWAGLGFAYCYLASSPILVFHAMRGISLKEILTRLNQKTDIPPILYFIAGFIVGLIVGFMVNRTEDLTFVRGASVFVVLIIVLLQIVFIVFGQREDGKAINDFYKNLIKQRSVKSIEREQYIESYKHLREHGNAFFIVILEIILAFSIWNVKSIQSLGIFILVWLAPGAWAWFIGTKMETKIDMFPNANEQNQNGNKPQATP
jgi:hypothetical protein